MSEDSNSKETIAILGGTGDLGTGLAIRWSKVGHKIVIGSRTLEKAQAAVEALQQISPETPAEAMENGDAAKAGDIVVLTVPAEHQESTLSTVKESLIGKILIDVTVPLVPPKVGTVQLPTEGWPANGPKRYLEKKLWSSAHFRTLLRICLKRTSISNAMSWLLVTRKRRDNGSLR